MATNREMIHIKKRNPDVRLQANPTMWWGKALAEPIGRLHLKPYWGKPTVRNFRGLAGNRWMRIRIPLHVLQRLGVSPYCASLLLNKCRVFAGFSVDDLGDARFLLCYVFDVVACCDELKFMVISRRICCLKCSWMVVA